LNDPGFEFGQGEDIFHVSEMSGQALGSTQPPVELRGGGFMSSGFWEMIKIVVYVIVGPQTLSVIITLAYFNTDFGN
jgi:hypothetical protein